MTWRRRILEVVGVFAVFLIVLTPINIWLSRLLTRPDGMLEGHTQALAYNVLLGVDIALMTVARLVIRSARGGPRRKWP